jgi:hypothetical protein
VRLWRARLDRGGQVSHAAVRERSYNPLVGKVEALAQLWSYEQSGRLAVRDSGGIRELLKAGVRPRQVDLAKALRLLSCGRARQASPHWLVLES